jgi:hypothetical protein
MATGNQVLRAYNRAAKSVAKDQAMSSTAVSAGYIIIPNGQRRGQREGYQVFVKLVKFSEMKLKLDPESGGLMGAL